MRTAHICRVKSGPGSIRMETSNSLRWARCRLLRGRLLLVRFLSVHLCSVSDANEGDYRIGYQAAVVFDVFGGYQECSVQVMYIRNPGRIFD